MPQFPNYLPMNNPYMQMQNPYMMNYLQQQTNQNATIGKMVDSVDVVKAADIPMDGNIYYFPKADGTEIFGKQWLSNGTTRILTFKPVIDTDVSNSSNNSQKTEISLSGESTRAFMERFDRLEKRLDGYFSQGEITNVKKQSTSNK